MQRNTVDVRQAASKKRRNPVVGKIALGLAVVSAAVDASAFAVFMGGDTNFAFGICFVVVFLTLIAAVLERPALTKAIVEVNTGATPIGEALDALAG